MKFARRLYALIYVCIAALFGVCALALTAAAAWKLVGGLNLFASSPLEDRFGAVLDSIGLLTIAVASLELSQTVIEEEVQREVLMSGPTRARRFLSRFLLVVVVSLSVEFLVLVFDAIHHDRERLPQAALLGAGTALLLAAWGVFVRLNRGAEELEPEAMEEAKQEDERVESA